MDIRKEYLRLVDLFTLLNESEDYNKIDEFKILIKKSLNDISNNLIIENNLSNYMINILTFVDLDKLLNNKDNCHLLLIINLPYILQKLFNLKNILLHKNKVNGIIEWDVTLFNSIEKLSPSEVLKIYNDNV